jgi:hypothetical protein
VAASRSTSVGEAVRYQLVLQWPVSSTDAYDAIVAIEDALIERLDGDAEVDGHDVGPNEMNIFIWTDDPLATFESAHSVIGEHALPAEVRAAFREASGDEYTVVWPRDLQTFVIA